MNIEDLKKLLRENVVNVVFTKVNGEKREMTCTLLADKLPPQESKKEPRESTNTISVWDLEKNNWRSFRLDSILSVNTIISGSEVILENTA